MATDKTKRGAPPAAAMKQAPERATSKATRSATVRLATVGGAKYAPTLGEEIAGLFRKHGIEVTGYSVVESKEPADERQLPMEPTTLHPYQSGVAGQLAGASDSQGGPAKLLEIPHELAQFELQVGALEGAIAALEKRLDVAGVLEPLPSSGESSTGDGKDLGGPSSSMARRMALTNSRLRFATAVVLNLRDRLEV